MIKKILSLITLFVLFNGSSFGQQACTPDPQYTNTSTQNGVYPDTIVNFVPAYTGTPYSQTVTLVIPPDTQISIFPPIVLPWDSTVLTDVTGLPAGFTYACYNSSAKSYLCSWKGNSIGCAILTGNPTTADVGTHALHFTTKNYVGGSSNPVNYIVEGYKLVVNDATNIADNSNIQVIQQNNPNPFSDLSEIQFTSGDNGIAKFKVYNMIGTVVREYDIAVKKGINKVELNAKDFNAGIYFYSLAQGTNAFTRKMIVKK